MDGLNFARLDESAKACHFTYCRTDYESPRLKEKHPPLRKMEDAESHGSYEIKQAEASVKSI